MSDPTGDAIRRNVEKFEREMDREMEKYFQIPRLIAAREAQEKAAREKAAQELKEQANKGVRLDKSEEIRQAYTSKPRYDSPERREALQKHLERMGVEKQLREVRNILEMGHGAEPGSGDRRSPDSRGSGMRGREERGREGLSRGDN